MLCVLGRIRVHGRRPRILVALNGVGIQDYTDPNPELLQPGPIGLQLHWLGVGDTADQEVQFRGLLVVDGVEEARLVTAG